MPQADRVLVRLEKLADVSYQFIDVIPYVFLWDLHSAIHIPVLAARPVAKCLFLTCMLFQYLATFPERSVIIS